VLTACGRSDAPVGETVAVEIRGDDNMKFDVTTIEAARRQPVEVTLINVGTMPKESMGHNFVLLTRGADVNDFVMVSATHARTEYIAPQKRNEVLASTRMLGPGERDTITFTAPAQAGTYEFICSFPGHAAAGMRGTLVVR
jgi:azurin